MSSGIAVEAETLEFFKNMQLRKEKCELLVMHIANEKSIEKKDTKEKCTNEELVQYIKDNKQTPLYIVHDFHTDKGTVLTFIRWVPDDAKVKPRMLYASSFEGIKPKFDGVKKYIQASDLDDVTLQSLKSSIEK